MHCSLEYAEELDRHDELAHFRNEFVIDQPDLIYLDGNSLGRLPKRAQSQLQHLIKIEWGNQLIRSWNEKWFSNPERVGAKLAGILGAQANEVIIADSTTINLFKLAHAAIKEKIPRTKIITDDMNFPSDLFALQSAAQCAGVKNPVEIVASPDKITMPVDRLKEAVDENTALVCLSHTTFKSGFVYDMAAVTEMVHKAGAFMIWDVSHSVGVVPMSFRDCEVDMAVGCTYKYVNGGPGSPAFLFVRRKLQNRLQNPLAGWFGSARQFAFDLHYKPATGIRRFLTGTPSVLYLPAIEAGIDLILAAGIDRIRAKSIRQMDYLTSLFQTLLAAAEFQFNSPQEPDIRGSHISIGHKHAYAITQALIREKNVIPDFRQPDNIRLSSTPLYTSYTDIFHGISRIKHVVDTGLFQKYGAIKQDVT